MSCETTPESPTVNAMDDFIKRTVEKPLQSKAQELTDEIFTELTRGGAEVEIVDPSAVAMEGFHVAVQKFEFRDMKTETDVFATLGVLMKELLPQAKAAFVKTIMQSQRPLVQIAPLQFQWQCGGTTHVLRAEMLFG